MRELLLHDAVAAVMGTVAFGFDHNLGYFFCQVEFTNIHCLSCPCKKSGDIYFNFNETRKIVTGKGMN